MIRVYLLISLLLSLMMCVTIYIITIVYFNILLGFLCGVCPNGTSVDMSLSVCLTCRWWHSIVQVLYSAWCYYSYAYSLMWNNNNSLCFNIDGVSYLRMEWLAIFGTLLFKLYTYTMLYFLYVPRVKNNNTTFYIILVVWVD